MNNYVVSARKLDEDSFTKIAEFSGPSSYQDALGFTRLVRKEYVEIYITVKIEIAVIDTKGCPADAKTKQKIVNQYTKGGTPDE